MRSRNYLRNHTLKTILLTIYPNPVFNCSSLSCGCCESSEISEENLLNKALLCASKSFFARIVVFSFGTTHMKKIMKIQKLLENYEKKSVQNNSNNNDNI